LSHFQSDSRTRGQLVDQSAAFRQETVGLVKFLGHFGIKPNHLHGTDLESARQDSINDFTSLFLFYNVWLNDAKTTILFVWF
jgi:hypothetical protein